ncbi:hypothetical protein TREMEDRAFT_59515 [Tremella mesenterica DSM 1558]|uniref:uncharacterized protein n=1 Tax=Tremella mesenterica (strain ATCC 24925 / CBS 8224 / DSM 1558 / NBRC 9311 / NRRL Y-6157 / RJB 2259-6 / UBC 559-6) TaxID=578456 RepID=UPI0003F49606|nr:uncharacterized protein TREMEDRAFT_59515 [Tremella mesenterica DSM 1558]EIW73349.1 hypothetical protein TREMEDRAFT_59515 [Tremella mesenterica DSM 1558]
MTYLQGSLCKEDREALTSRVEVAPDAVDAVQGPLGICRPRFPGVIWPVIGDMEPPEDETDDMTVEGKTFRKPSFLLMSLLFPSSQSLPIHRQQEIIVPIDVEHGMILSDRSIPLECSNVEMWSDIMSTRTERLETIRVRIMATRPIKRTGTSG